MAGQDNAAQSGLDRLGRVAAGEIRGAIDPVSHWFETVMGFQSPWPRPDRDSSPKERRSGDAGALVALPQGSVVTVVIDDGLGIANRRFRHANGETRVLFFLDMNARPLGSRVEPAHCHEHAAGRCWSKAVLDEVFEAEANEERVYRRLGLIDPGRVSAHANGSANPLEHDRQSLRFSMSHGTHVLDLAAGHDPDATDAAFLEKRPIIAIQLPDRVVNDRSDSLMAEALLNALDWLESALKQLVVRESKPDRPVPFVVNFSFGDHTGPRDRSDPIGEVIGAFIRRHADNPCEFVIAGGNGLQARARAVLRLEPGSSSCIDWRVLPDDRTSSFVEVWLPPSQDTTQQVAIRLEPERRGPASVIESRLHHMIDWQENGHVLARIYHQLIETDHDHPRERITIALRPTASADFEAPVCPHGRFRLTVIDRRSNLERELLLDARIQRDDPVPGLRRQGRQSWFDDPDYVRFDPLSGRLSNDERDESGPVRRQGTLNSYAAARGATIVGGYVESNGKPAFYSASGEIVPGHRSLRGPSFSAPCETSPAHRGQIASGTLSGSSAIMNGTSVAAPHVTRCLVNELSNAMPLPDPPAQGVHGLYNAPRRTRHGHNRIIACSRSPQTRRIDDQHSSTRGRAVIEGSGKIGV